MQTVDFRIKQRASDYIMEGSEKRRSPVRIGLADGLRLLASPMVWKAVCNCIAHVKTFDLLTRAQRPGRGSADGGLILSVSFSDRAEKEMPFIWDGLGLLASLMLWEAVSNSFAHVKPVDLS